MRITLLPVREKIARSAPLFLSLFLTYLFLWTLCGCAKGKPLSEPQIMLKLPTPVRIGEGAFPKFSPDGKLIAFTLCEEFPRDANGISYEIYTMKPDGTCLECLTGGKPELEGTRWKGQSFWHPSGDYITFTAENARYPRKGIGTTARPGLGRNHNVWIMTKDGRKFWQITDYPENWGVIRPSFSKDGSLLFWNEEYSMEKYPQGRPEDPDDDPGTPGWQGHPGSYWGSESFRYRKGEEFGAWRMRIAKISFENGEPKASDLLTVELPEGFTLIEGAGFTPSGDSLICSCVNLKETKGKGLWGDICTVEFSGKIIRRLTRTPFIHDENPEFSPDGRRIIWNASQGDPGEGEELWIMDSDGKNKTRLTHFAKRGFKEYDPCARQITEFSWNPDGKSVIFGHVSLPVRAKSRLPSTLYRLDLVNVLRFLDSKKSKKVR